MDIGCIFSSRGGEGAHDNTVSSKGPSYSRQVLRENGFQEMRGRGPAAEGDFLKL